MNRSFVTVGTVALWVTLLVHAFAEDPSWRTCYESAQALSAVGEWDTAFRKANAALSLSTAVNGELHIKTAKSLDLLADICAERGRVQQGLVYRKRSLKIREDLLGKDHPTVVQALTSLADMYRCGEEEEMAGQLYREALNRAKSGGWSESPCVTGALEGLGYLAVLNERFAEADRMYRKALHLHELTRKYAPYRDACIARDLMCLAEINRTMRNYAEASRLYRSALKNYLASAGPNSRLTAHCMKRLGELYAQWNKPARATAYYKRALAVYRRNGVIDDPMVAATLIRLAQVYDNQGKLAKAETLSKKAAAIYERAGIIDKRVASTVLKSAKIWP